MSFLCIIKKKYHHGAVWKSVVLHFISHFYEVSALFTTCKTVLLMKCG